MVTTYDAIIRDLKNKIVHPVYLLEGEEPYFIDLVSDYIENNLLPEAERSFNQTVLYGKDTTVNEIRQRAMNYPMFSNYQVLIVKEAQMLKKWDELLKYVENPVRTTILVLCHRYENFDKRTKVGKLMKERPDCVLMTTKKLYDNQVPEWINQYLAERKFSISHHAAALLVEYVGNELSRVANELEKLILNVGPGKEISADDIEKNIGISKEYNTFELSKALGLRDVLKANRIVSYFKANPKPNPLVLTIGSLYGYFSRIYLMHQAKPKTDSEIVAVLGIKAFSVIINEYKTAARNYSPQKTEQVIGLLQDYDLRSKGVNDTGSEEAALLKELVYKILH